MATLSARGTSVPTTSGTTWATTANAFDGATGTNPATYATWTNAVASAVGYLEITGYHTVFGALPATFTAVTLRLRNLVSATARFTAVQFQPYDGATPIGSIATGTLNTAAHDDNAAFTVTRAQLISSAFKVRATATRATGTISSVWSVDHLDVLVDYVPAKTATLVDTFDTQVDPNAWSSTGTVAWNAGRAAITELSAAYSEIRSRLKFDLSESALYAQVVPPATGATSRETGIAVAADSANGLTMMTSGTGPISLVMRHRQTGTNDDVGITYDPVAHAYWRLRTAGTSIFWDTSSDGVTWTNRRTRTSTLVLTSVDVILSCGQWQVEGGGLQTAYFDNVNIVPPTVKVSTFTDTFDTQIDPAKWAVTGNAVWSTGQAAITDQATTVYSQIDSVNSYDLTASNCTVKMVAPTVVDASREAGLEMYADANNGISIFWGASPAQLYCRFRQGGVNNDLQISYDATAHSWLRIRVDATNAYWETSPDAVTWTARRTVALSTFTAVLTSVKVRLFCGQWAANATNSTAYFDNLNTAASGTGRPKVWTGAAFVNKPAKVWTGAAWVEKPVKTWTGSTWKLAK